MPKEQNAQLAFVAHLAVGSFCTLDLVHRVAELQAGELMEVAMRGLGAVEDRQGLAVPDAGPAVGVAARSCRAVRCGPGAQVSDPESRRIAQKAREPYSMADLSGPTLGRTNGRNIFRNQYNYDVDFSEKFIFFSLASFHILVNFPDSCENMLELHGRIGCFSGKITNFSKIFAGIAIDLN